MGWIAITREGEILREGEAPGRPVNEGEDGKLSMIMQEDFGHKVAVDLLSAVIVIDYEDFSIIEENNLQIINPKAVLYITDETNIAGDYGELITKANPDENLAKAGWVINDFTPLIWRPIWFTRYTNGTPTKVIGLQTTYQGRNYKKMVCLFEDGRIGID